MTSETTEKRTQQLIIEMFLICCLVLLELHFFTNINAFLDKLLDSFGLGSGGWLLFSTVFIYMPVILAPFALLSYSYATLLERIKVRDVSEGLFSKLLFVNGFAAIFCSLFWIIKARGISEAAVYEFENFNFLLLGAVVLFSYYGAKPNLKSTAGLAHGLKTAFFVCFGYVFYLWLGFDDGCVTTGGDRLFGGGGETDCDPNYVKQRDRLDSVEASGSFNSNSVFAVRYLWMVTVSFTTIITFYFLKIRPREL